MVATRHDDVVPLIRASSVPSRLGCHVAGCLNGGGQLKAVGAEAGRELLKTVTDVYESLPLADSSVNNDVDAFYECAHMCSLNDGLSTAVY